MSTTPYEIWKGKKPGVTHIKIWGCPAHVKRHNLDKLESRTKKCYFVRYPKESFGYYFYNLYEHKVIVTKHAIFHEDEFILDGDSERKVDLEEVLHSPPQNDMEF